MEETKTLIVVKGLVVNRGSSVSVMTNNQCRERSDSKSDVEERHT